VLPFSDKETVIVNESTDDLIKKPLGYYLRKK